MLKIGFTASAGQLTLSPVQVSARSHAPTAARHTVPLGDSASAGQLALEPVHVSATSHMPTAARHVVPAATSASAGLSQELVDDTYEDDAEAAAAGVVRVVPQRPRVLRVDGCH